jgi:8-oxo-dGTP diphosphatase
MSMDKRRFNIRVYFLLFHHDLHAVLVSDEIIRKGFYTKFPGGGLEWGEGLTDAIRREAAEELGQAVEIEEHVYTTDFFVQSRFREEDQVVAVYYKVRLLEPPKFRIALDRYSFTQSEDNEESFRWVPLTALAAEHFAFDADRTVVEILLNQASSRRAT